MGSRGLVVVGALLGLLAQGPRSQEWHVAVTDHLSAPVPQSGSRLGSALDFDGERAILADLNRNVLVFVHEDGGWEFEAALPAAPGASATFGTSVAIHGPWAAVGDLQRNPPTGPGVVHMYEHSPTGWAYHSTVTASNGVTSDDFGDSVDLRGDRLAVGADETRRGYVFDFIGGAWIEQAILLPIGGGEYGEQVAIAQDRVMVGGRGSVAVVHRREAGSWVVEGVLNANPSVGASFGLSLALADEIAAVGTGYEVFVFRRDVGGWVEDELIESETAPQDSFFGYALSLAPDGSVLAVGAPDATGGGRAFVYEHDDAEWELRLELSDTPGAGSSDLGARVAVQDGSVIASNRLATVASQSGAGRASVFRLNPAWEQVGAGVAGSVGVPAVAGFGDLSADSVITLELHGAKAFAVAPLVASLSALNAPFKGGTMIPDVDFVFPLFTDFSGDADIAAIWPVGAPSGLPVYFQWWVKDPGAVLGYAATRGLIATTP